MYQLNETRVRREPPARSGEVVRHAARRDENGRSEIRLRVVRAPGGFAFVEDSPDTRRS
jgi:hypothetical protein